MTLAPALLAAALLATESPAQPTPSAAATAPSPLNAAQPLNAAKATAGAKKGAPRVLPAASLPTVEGEIAGIDHRAHRLRLETATGEVVLEFDRNTLVRGPAGAITPLQLPLGARVRAGRDGDVRAAWIDLKATSSSPKATP